MKTMRIPIAICLIGIGFIHTGCDERGMQVASSSLSVQFDDVYMAAAGATPQKASASTPDSTVSVTRFGDSLGAVVDNTQQGCKLVPVFWIPTQPAEIQPTTDRVVQLCTLMPVVTAGSWKKATAKLSIITDGGDAFRVVIDAKNLVPNSLYSVSLFYEKGGSAYAVGPVGGFPNLLFPDDHGNATFDHRVSARDLRSGSIPLNAVPTTKGAPSPLVIDPSSMLRFALYYHSNAQSNGNATAAPTTAGAVAFPGSAIGPGVDVHLHLTGSTAVLP